MTDEFKDLLDRDRSKVEALAVRKVATPLLCEIVNHGSMALARCSTMASGQPDVDIAPLFLYHQALEITDGIQVLIENACARVCKPLLRSLLETLLSVEFILQDDVVFQSRSLSWYVGFLHTELDECIRSDERTLQGREFALAWKEIHGSEPDMGSPEALDARRETLQARLAMPHLRPLEQVWEKRAKQRKPRWFNLCSDAPDLRSLVIEHLPHRVPDYDLLYRSWSAMSHAQDPTDVVTVHDGTVAFWPIRYVPDLAFVARMAASDALSVTRTLIRKYRPDEGASVAKWYGQDLKPLLDRLEELHREVLAGTSES